MTWSLIVGGAGCRAIFVPHKGEATCQVYKIDSVFPRRYIPACNFDTRQLCEATMPLLEKRAISQQARSASPSFGWVRVGIGPLEPVQVISRIA